MQYDCLTACRVNSDIVMVLDESGSVTEDNFELVRQFVIQYVDSLQIGPDENRVGVITFNESAWEQFSLDTHTNAASLRNAVAALPYSQGGGTNIPDALCQLLRVVTSDARTDPSVFRVAIVVVTDGRNGTTTNDCGYTTVAEASAALKTASPPINVFAIGVGSNVQREDLEAIVSQEQYIFNPADFSQLLCAQSVQEEQICNTSKYFVYVIIITTTLPSSCKTGH